MDLLVFLGFHCWIHSALVKRLGRTECALAKRSNAKDSHVGDGQAQSHWMCLN